MLIPCYNEAQTIYNVVVGMREALPNATIYVYDNNSDDMTAELAKQGGAVVRHECRQGKGNVIRTMFREIEADCYLLVDGDDTYPVENAKAMCDLVLSKKADMVIGDRSSTYCKENKRIFHNAGNALVKRMINFFWDADITDVMTGYRAFSPMFVKSFPIVARGFEIETEMTVHALDKNLIIASIPVKYRDRPVGSVSKLNTYIDGLKVIRAIFDLYRNYKPMSFFGFVSVMLLMISLTLFFPIMEYYIVYGTVPRFPTLFVSLVLGLASFLACVCGLILSTNVQNSRRNIEVQMNIIQMNLNIDSKIKNIADGENRCRE